MKFLIEEDSIAADPTEEDMVLEHLIVLNYDITGYTHFCNDHASKLLYYDILKLTMRVVGGCNKVIRMHGGNPYLPTGDGYTSSFPEYCSEQALDAAIAIQHKAKELEIEAGFPKEDLYLKAALYKGICPLMECDGVEKPIPIGNVLCNMSRLEREARPGEILCSDSVLLPVMDLYRVEEIPSLYMKGTGSGAERVYRVLGKK